MNHLLNRKSLKNDYFAIRHGKSFAQIEGVILSDPAIGTSYRKPRFARTAQDKYFSS